MAVRAAPPAGSLRFAVSGAAPGGGNWANTFWIATTVATPTTAEMNTITSGLLTAWDTIFRPKMGSNWTITLGKCTYYGASGYVIVGEDIVTQAGTGTANAMPDQVCTVISWLVSTTWRGGKPRTYWPRGLQNADLADLAHLSAATVTDIETDAASWLSAVNAFTSAPLTSCTLGTLRFFSGGVPLTTPVFLPYTGTFVHPRLGTIRRRLGRET